MPKLTRKQYIGWKAEGTAGTAESLANSDYYLAENINWSFNGDDHSRRTNIGQFGQPAGVTGGRWVTVSFDVEIAGSGSAGTAPDHSVLLQACGLTETVVAATSVTYAESSAFSDQGHCTIRWFADGVEHVANGCLGNVSLNLEAGALGKYSFTMTGRYDGNPADTANPSPSYSTVVPPTCLASTYTLDAFSPVATALTTDLGNTVSTRRSLTDSDGFEIPAITDRLPVGTSNIEVPAISSKALVSLWKAKTKMDLTYTLGSTGGNIISLTGDVVLQGSPPAISDGEGIHRYGLTWSYVTNDLAGDNAIVIVYT